MNNSDFFEVSLYLHLCATFPDGTRQILITRENNCLYRGPSVHDYDEFIKSDIDDCYKIFDIFEKYLNRGIYLSLEITAVSPFFARPFHYRLKWSDKDNVMFNFDLI